MDTALKRSGPLFAPVHGLGSATTSSALNQHSTFAGFVKIHAKALSSRGKTTSRHLPTRGKLITSQMTWSAESVVKLPIEYLSAPGINDNPGLVLWATPKVIEAAKLTALRLPPPELRLLLSRMEGAPVFKPNTTPPLDSLLQKIENAKEAAAADGSGGGKPAETKLDTDDAPESIARGTGGADQPTINTSGITTPKVSPISTRPGKLLGRPLTPTEVMYDFASKSSEREPQPTPDTNTRTPSAAGITKTNDLRHEVETKTAEFKQTCGGLYEALYLSK
jgi:hypothetical protein